MLARGARIGSAGYGRRTNLQRTPEPGCSQGIAAGQRDGGARRARPTPRGLACGDGLYAPGSPRHRALGTHAAHGHIRLADPGRQRICSNAVLQYLLCYCGHLGSCRGATQLERTPGSPVDDFSVTPYCRITVFTVLLQHLAACWRAVCGPEYGTVGVSSASPVWSAWSHRLGCAQAGQ